MPERAIVIDTTPLIALSAAGCFEILSLLYTRVVVPKEVAEEIRAGGPGALGFAELANTATLEFVTTSATPPTYIANSIDRGEAAVIATALDKQIDLVCIDEIVGRRVARLAGLAVTGSLGVMVKAKRTGFPIVIRDAIDRMRERGIWLSASVIDAALVAADE